MSTLVLCDIDGTLLGHPASCPHVSAVRQAIRMAWGIPAPPAAALAGTGQTDLGIAWSAVHAAGGGLSKFTSRSALFCQEADRLHAAECQPDLSSLVLPGIPPLLAWLSGTPGIRLAAVSGGIKRIACRKLDRAGLGGFFRPALGTYGCQAVTRRDLLWRAWHRCGAPRHVIVIDDTPEGIIAAREAGMTSVAVATGAYGIADLAAADYPTANADGVFSALRTELSRRE